MWLLAAIGVAECRVVSVVVSERMEGAGEENVLSFPRRKFPNVPFVPCPDDGALEGAWTEFARPVEVAAMDLFSIVGVIPSSEDWSEPLQLSEEVLEVADNGVDDDRWG